RIRRLELELDLPSSQVLSPQDRTAKRQEIRQCCNQIIALEGSRSASAILAKRNNLDALITKQSIDNVVAEINRLKGEGKSRTFPLAIDAIRHQQQLLLHLDRLLSLLGADGDSRWKERINQLRDEANGKIADLEPQRCTQDEGRYPTGTRKSLVRMRDGRRQGSSEYWYESGATRIKAHFLAGKLYGESKCWREDGSLCAVLDVPAIGEPVRWTLCLEEGQKISAFQFGDNDGHGDIWLWNGVYAGRVGIRNGRVRKVGFIFRLLGNLKFWSACFKAMRKPEEWILMEKMVDTLSQGSGFFDELLVLAKET